jgi:hypothetical protein
VADSSSTDPGGTPLLHRAGTVAAGIGSLGEGRPRLRAAIQYGLIALVFAFLAFFLITQWSKLPDYDWRFRPAWLVPAFLLVVATTRSCAPRGPSRLWRATCRRAR